MADKIKAFFHKAKLDAKFMNAGKGHKLTESTSIAESTSIIEPKKRVEPTKEAKVAGQAALARLEAKESNTKKFNTSYAAIKAQVKQELEQERKAQQEKKAQQEAQKNHVPSEEQIQAAIKDNSLLAVTNIYYRCPYLSNEILSQDEWKDKVVPIKGALEFLNAAGFRQKKLLNNDKEEDFLVWSEDNCSMEDLITLLEALKTAEPIPLELDRNLQVLLPIQASKRTELPQSFFNLTAEDIKKEQQLRSEAVERDQMLRTKAMRERDEKEKLRKYKFSLIRIKFPDNLILQGTFSVHENFRNVTNFVSENLINGDKPFNLKRLPETTFGEDTFDKTLLELGLFPAALLIFVWKNKSGEITCNESAGYLKEELLSIIQPA
ncbi:GDI interacting protein 3 isoform X2 [Xylocopa sonorina]|uniref:GDI interacting protein 3 isoform X2 n=1 Tax=Xylocopa sonorina TaxID=1818115 RepID=UPI00403AAB47